MSICLGNLTVAEIESRAGVTFPQDLKDFMLANHQSKASNIEAGKWHCFDIPFFIQCGDMETAVKIHGGLSHLGSQFKEPLSFGVQE